MFMSMFMAVFASPINCGSSSLLIFSSPISMSCFIDLGVRLRFQHLLQSGMVGRAIWIHQPAECFMGSFIVKKQSTLCSKGDKEKYQTVQPPPITFHPLPPLMMTLPGKYSYRMLRCQCDLSIFRLFQTTGRGSC